MFPLPRRRVFPIMRHCCEAKAIEKGISLTPHCGKPGSRALDVSKQCKAVPAACVRSECGTPTCVPADITAFCMRPGCERPTWNGKPGGFCSRSCKSMMVRPTPVCMTPDCGKPTWNGKPNGFCSKPCRSKMPAGTCIRPGCGKATFDGRPLGYCSKTCRNQGAEQHASWACQVNWMYEHNGHWHFFDPRMSAALDAAHAEGPGSVVELAGRGFDYVVDLGTMTQTNRKTGKVRNVHCRALPSNNDPDTLVPKDVRASLVAETSACWVCQGEGVTSKWLEPFDDASKFNDVKARDEKPECPVCFTEATYSVSTSCEHLFCDTCIQFSLQAMLDVGQLPAFCPQCRAESGGREPACGRIDDEALAYLQWAGVITKEFLLRFVKQQNRTLDIKEPDYFECPGKCGEWLLAEDVAYEAKNIGKVHNGPNGKPVYGLGSCPSCSVQICVNCHSAADDPHTCPHIEEEIKARKEEDDETLKMIATVGKKCPHCGVLTQKNDGCNFMTCSQCKQCWCWETGKKRYGPGGCGGGHNCH